MPFNAILMLFEEKKYKVGAFSNSSYISESVEIFQF